MLFKNRLGDERHYPGSMAQSAACLARVAGHRARGWAIAGPTRGYPVPSRLRRAPGDEDAGAAALLAQGLNVGRDDR